MLLVPKLQMLLYSLWKKAQNNITIIFTNSSDGHQLSCKAQRSLMAFKSNFPLWIITHLCFLGWFSSLCFPLCLLQTPPDPDMLRYDKRNKAGKGTRGLPKGRVIWRRGYERDSGLFPASTMPAKSHSLLTANTRKHLRESSGARSIKRSFVQQEHSSSVFQILSLSCNFNLRGYSLLRYCSKRAESIPLNCQHFGAAVNFMCPAWATGAT